MCSKICAQVHFKTKCCKCEVANAKVFYMGKRYCYKCYRMILRNEMQQKREEFYKKNEKSIDTLFRKTVRNLNLGVMKD